MKILGRRSSSKVAGSSSSMLQTSEDIPVEYLTTTTTSTTTTSTTHISNNIHYNNNNSHDSTHPQQPSELKRKRESLASSPCETSFSCPENTATVAATSKTDEQMSSGDTGTRSSSRSLSPGPSPAQPTRRHRRLASSPPDIASPSKTHVVHTLNAPTTMTTTTTTTMWDPLYLKQCRSENDEKMKYLVADEAEDLVEEDGGVDDEDESSIETQESEYLVDCSSKYTNSTNRLTCLVYKRKEGFSGKMKHSYAVASEKRKYIGHKVHQNIGAFPLALGWSSNGKEFWKLGKGHLNASNVNGNANVNVHASNAAPQVKMWEKRRLVLEGRLLMYYHEKAELEEDEEGEEGQDDDYQNVSPKGSGEKEDSEDENGNHEYKRRDESGRSINTMSSKNASSGLQRWREKMNELVEHAHLKSPSQAVINSPKGVIDLVASCATATVVPISRHSFAPTPYCLAILVKSEVKWMLCFEDEKEILKWLNVFTKIALKQSVERYSKNHGKEYEGQEERLIPCDDMVRASKDEKMRGDIINNNNKSTSNHGIQQSVREGDMTGRLEDTKKQRSDTSLLSVMSLADYDTYRVVVLVNSAFLYLFLVVEEITTVSHIAVFIIVNICTWFHIRYSNRNTGQLPMDRMLDKQSLESAKVTVNTKDSILSNVTTDEDEKEDEDKNTPKSGRHIVASASFIERRKSDDYDDQSNTYRPTAGSSTIQFKHPHESHMNADNEEMVAWIAANPSIIHLRGDDYLISKKKVPSSTSLYELVQLDAFDSDEHMTDVGQKFRFSPQDFGSSGNWCAPDTLIISFALPTTAPKLGRSSLDGQGYIVCGYFRIRSEVRKVLEIISNPNFDANERHRQIHVLFPDAKKRSIVNGVKLWEKWCRTSATDPEMQKRLKFIPRGENLNELGVPSWICRYNGKPMLIKRPGETSFIFSHPDDRTLEIDVNLHPLPFMFKQAMAYLKEHYFARMLMTFGFVIEGREDDELPEVLLGNPIQLPFNNPDAVIKAEALFGGNDIASF